MSSLVSILSLVSVFCFSNFIQVASLSPPNMLLLVTSNCCKLHFYTLMVPDRTSYYTESSCVSHIWCFSYYFFHFLLWKTVCYVKNFLFIVVSFCEMVFILVYFPTVSVLLMYFFSCLCYIHLTHPSCFWHSHGSLSFSLKFYSRLCNFTHFKRLNLSNPCFWVLLYLLNSVLWLMVSSLAEQGIKICCKFKSMLTYCYHCIIQTVVLEVFYYPLPQFFNEYTYKIHN